MTQRKIQILVIILYWSFFIVALFMLLYKKLVVVAFFVFVYLLSTLLEKTLYTRLYNNLARPKDFLPKSFHQSNVDYQTPNLEKVNLFIIPIYNMFLD